MSPSPAPRPDSLPPEPDSVAAQMMTRSPGQTFGDGMAHTLPFLIVLIPFALLFGVVSLEAGLNIVQVMGFSMLVLAGASQFTAVQLITDHAPVWLVIVSGLTVNLRMAMYSASLVPWLKGASGTQKSMVAFTLIDQSYALSIQYFERFPRLSLQLRLAYYGGCSLVLCTVWIGFSLLGATIGRTITDNIALDFAMPITFLALIAPMLRTIPHLIACFISIVGALIFAGLPSGLGLMIAAPIGMAAGALAETYQESRRHD